MKSQSMRAKIQEYKSQNIRAWVVAFDSQKLKKKEFNGVFTDFFF